MYLSVKQKNPLDNAVKAFEVAYRSYCVRTILSKYTTADLLASEISDRIDKYKGSNAILGGRVFSELNKQLVRKKVKQENGDDREIVSLTGTFWNNLLFALKCYQQQEHVESHDVSYLKTLNCLMYSFSDLYVDVIKAFSEPEEFIAGSFFYYDVRNALSHPASDHITKINAQHAVEFMKRVGSTIPQDCFWYCSWEDILDSIVHFELQLNNGADEYGLLWQNIHEIPLPDHAIVCREKEISDLYKWVCGWNGSKVIPNTKHAVCISGYGGVGKTALVAEFLFRLLNQLESGSYKGSLTPKFILFYSAKSKVLDFKPYSLNFHTERVKSQFQSYDELRGKIEKDLPIANLGDDREGIIVLDNLESLSKDDRNAIMNYIFDELPSYIRVIITSRVPEDADGHIKLAGFQEDDGIEFIHKYIETNNFVLNIDTLQTRDLVRYSYGNTLILVLALRRINTKKVTSKGMIDYLKNLPKHEGNEIMASFMYQKTVDEIYGKYGNCGKNIEILNDILCYFCVCYQELNADIIAQASGKWNVDEIKIVLDDLSEYLVIDQKNDKYVINKFARRYILVKTPFSDKVKRAKEGEIVRSYNEFYNALNQLIEQRESSGKLDEILKDWGATTDSENLAISEAFAVWKDLEKIGFANTDYDIEQSRKKIERIQRVNNPHPFVFHQWARMLIQLKRDGYIDKQYDDEIEEYYSKCFLMIDDESFEFIKATKSYPSIQRIFAQFLLESGKITNAMYYCDASIANYRSMRIKDNNYYDVLAMYGYINALFYQDKGDTVYASNAKSAMTELRRNNDLPPIACSYKGKLAMLLPN